MLHEARIRTFGALRLEVGEGTILHRPLKGFALLAYLSARGKPIHRAEAAALLWDPSKTPNGLRSLSQVLYELKRVLPVGSLLVRGDTIHLVHDAVHSDVREFQALLGRGSHAEAVRVFDAPFLHNLPFLTEEFDDWRSTVGALVERDAHLACKEVVAAALDNADLDKAIEYCQRGLSIRPFDTDLAVSLISSLSASGQPAAAKRELEAKRFIFEKQHGNYPPELGASLEARLSNTAATPCVSVPHQHRLSMIGRERELADIQHKWETAEMSGWATVVLRGEPGIGKSRLMDHVLRKAVLRGTRYLFHRCAEVESTLPYSAIAGLLRSAAHVLEPQALHEADQEALSTILPDLVPAAVARQVPNRLRLWEAIARAVESIVSTKPALIAIDNFHWLDEGSRGVLTFVKKWLVDRHVLLIIAGRGGLLVKQFDDEGGGGPPTIIDLAVLDDARCDKLFNEYEQKSGSAVPLHVRQYLKEKVGGRPLLLIEALNDAWAGGFEAETEIRSTRIDAIISNRLGRLDEESQRLVAAAAVLNRDIHLFDLSQIAALKPDAAAAAADKLIELGLFQDSTTVRFTHDILRDVALRSLTGPQRLSWHHKIASYLERTGTTRFAEVAFHYEEAGDKASAFRFASLSAGEAQQLFSYHDAETGYQRMLRCASVTETPGAQAEFFKYLISLGRFNDAEPLVQAVESHFERTGDQDGALLCSIVRYSRAVRKSGVPASEGAQQARNFVKLLAEHSPHRLARVIWQLADPLKSTGDVELLGSFADDLKEFIETRALDAASQAEILSVAALVAMVAQGYSVALPIAEQAVKIADKAKESGVKARAKYARGTISIVSGKLNDARRDYDEILNELNAELPEETVTRLKTNYCVLLMEQGRYDEAYIMAQVALRESDRTRSAYIYGNMALSCLRQHDAAGAQRYADAVSQCRSSSPYPWIEPHVNAIMGLADLINGDMHAARDRWERASNEIALAGGVMDCSTIYELGGRVKALDGDVAGAAQILDAGISMVAHRDYLAGCRLLLLRTALIPPSPAQDAVVAEIRANARAWGASVVAAAAEQLLEASHPPDRPVS